MTEVHRTAYPKMTRNDGLDTLREFDSSRPTNALDSTVQEISTECESITTQHPDRGFAVSVGEPQKVRHQQPPAFARPTSLAFGRHGFTDPNDRRLASTRQLWVIAN